ncbi:MAG: hypothetical protein Q8K99_12985 [Actinomycetota bacterium]|nr:hypothetical protein [Actinomycetota bacterium]
MQFVVTCPVDGPVEVALEDVDTVVLREPEQAEVVFTCPECGAEISVSVRVPSFLMAAIEAMAEDGGGRAAPLAGIMALAGDMDIEIETADEERIDSYCEYFRQQLAEVTDVSDMLREIGCDDDGRTR